MIHRFLLLFLLLSTKSVVAIQLAGATDSFSAYLFVYFTGNKISQEAIRFALSDDAHTFKQLNKGKPVLSSATISRTGGVRDPHILRGENNDYYMVATDMVSDSGWDSNRGIVMLKSTDLIDWKSSTINITTAFIQYKNVDRVWAPQTIYDPAVGKYMVYFAMRIGSNDKDKIYYAYTNSEFTKLETEPKLLFTYKSGDKILPSIDGDIIYKDSMYHLFFKTEGSEKGIKKATSKTLTGTYTLYDKYLQATTEAVEGSCVFKLNNSDTYILMYDVYNAGRYEFTTSIDLKTFTKDPKPISFDFAPRHGTIIPITNAEKNALLAKWNPTELITNHKRNRHSMICYTSANVFEFKFERVINNLTVSIIDLSGKELHSWNTSGKLVKIYPPKLSPGIYHIYCRTNTENIWYTRIIIK